MKNWRPDNPYSKIAYTQGNMSVVLQLDAYEAGADAMYKADVAFLKRHHPALSYRSDRVGFITIDIQKEDWESFIKEIQ